MLRRMFLGLLATPIAAVGLRGIMNVPAHAASKPLDAAVFYVSLNVQDFERSFAWYQEKLGFQVEVAWHRVSDGRRLAYLKKNDTRLELITTDDNPLRLPEPNNLAEHFNRTGYGHICFAVQSVDVALARLAEADVPTFVPAETHDLGETGYRRRVGFVKDPEGNLIEFGEPLMRVG